MNYTTNKLCTLALAHWVPRQNQTDTPEAMTMSLYIHDINDATHPGRLSKNWSRLLRAGAKRFYFYANEEEIEVKADGSSICLLRRTCAARTYNVRSTNHWTRRLDHTQWANAFWNSVVCDVWTRPVLKAIQGAANMQRKINNLSTHLAAFTDELNPFLIAEATVKEAMALHPNDKAGKKTQSIVGNTHLSIVDAASMLCQSPIYLDSWKYTGLSDTTSNILQYQILGFLVDNPLQHLMSTRNRLIGKYGDEDSHDTSNIECVTDELQDSRPGLYKEVETVKRLGHLLPQELDNITLIYSETAHDILWNTIDYFAYTVIPTPGRDNPGFHPIHWLALLDIVDLPHQHDHCGKTEARESNMCTLYDVHFIALLTAISVRRDTRLKANSRLWYRNNPA
ncbi:hypothetical protein BO85DRAFT_438143 [Aspergillus piperis CBS 112811]|uniref:Uncharacterized protein n=1 Tax=Aspergillus piperis CBS 112811 TaxID=1448313 RepID=A0A8G1R0N8_9EURO|nr:hypothetical protein BO85DRAFT_438143 [Aspergillus piperis CBS 112811]RAH57911.1 hypothetical protein BO85DRAFT_438143 [Aspergillus piperis CBS 112811]